MDLKSYLWKHKTTARKLREKIGCSYSAMTAYVRRDRKPCYEMAKRIEEATNFEVTVNELISGKYTTDYDGQFITKVTPPKKNVENKDIICI